MDKMALIDAVGYTILIIVIFIVIYKEYQHYVCDNLRCDSVKWASDRTDTDKEYQIYNINNQNYQSIWMRAFYISAFLTFFSYWWFWNAIPPFISFMVVMTFFFVVYYFSFTYYQHHYLRPVNADLIGYIKSSCTDEDGRK